MATSRRSCRVSDWDDFPSLPGLPTCNVLITGRAGAGKSTLINAVFGAELAPTGVGGVVTREPRRYAEPGIPVTILDTRGLELGERDGRATEITEEIDRRAGATGKEQLHVAWYCVAAQSDRIDPGEELHIAALARRLPIIVVVTQSINEQADTLARQIAAYGLDGVRDVVTVLAKPRDLAGVHIEARGLEDLVRTTVSALINQGLRMALVNAQRVSLSQKLEAAETTLAARISEPDGIVAKLSSSWSYDIDRWSIRPVQRDLMTLLTDLALPFGMSVPHLNRLIELAEQQGRGPTSSTDYWLRYVHSDAPVGVHAREAVSRFGRLYLGVAEQVARADIDGEALSDAAIWRLLNNRMASRLP